MVCVSLTRVDDLVEGLVQRQRLWYYRARNELERVLKERQLEREN